MNWETSGQVLDNIVIISSSISDEIVIGKIMIMIMQIIKITCDQGNACI